MRGSPIDDLQAQLSELQRLVAAQASEITGLRADMRRSELGDTAVVARNPKSDIAGTVGASEPPQKLSRRAFARLGAMAGAGAAAAATVAVLGADASPAGAAVGRDVLLGKDNKGATGRTGIFATGGSPYATLADPSVSTGVKVVLTGPVNGNPAISAEHDGTRTGLAPCWSRMTPPNALWGPVPAL
jgi:hypothetical protein